MQPGTDFKTATDTGSMACRLASMGLPKEHSTVFKVRGGLSAATNPGQGAQVCLDALPVAGWRSIGKDRSTSKRDQGYLYSAWLPLFSRRAHLELDVVLSGGTAALPLERRADCD